MTAKADAPAVVITAARVDCPDGTPAAHIELVEIGGGSQTVTVDGIPEERIHPRSQVHHVRLISPDRMLPDTLREAGSYDEAVKLGTAYAVKLAAHAGRAAELAADLEL